MQSLTQTKNDLQKAIDTIETLARELIQHRALVERYYQTFGRELPYQQPIILKDSVVFGWHLGDNGSMMIDRVDTGEINLENRLENALKTAKELTS